MDLTPTLTVAGTPEGVREAISAMEAWTAETPLAPDTCRNVLTAIDEVLSNIVRHGFKGSEAGEMTVRPRLTGDGLTVEIADTAPPFNPLLVPAPDVDLPLERRRTGGLGIALVRALSDDAAYAYRLGRNVFTLSWRLRSDAPSGRTDEHP